VGKRHPDRSAAAAVLALAWSLTLTFVEGDPGTCAGGQRETRQRD
jgi:hypothetical protein